MAQGGGAVVDAWDGNCRMTAANGRLVNAMCPSAWVMAGPTAMYLAVQELAQRTTMVRALASVATSRSPVRTPALISSEPGRRRMLFMPGCLLPLEKCRVTTGVTRGCGGGLPGTQTSQQRER
jgi:hypothetical protein